MVKVLIVDDAAFMRMSLRSLLERNGYEVIGEAENGNMALKKYQELKPDIVTMDITMPDMDGIDALKAIRNIDAEAKVIMISAMGQEKMVMNAVMAGAKGFIIKPYKDDHVLKTLEKIL